MSQKRTGFTITEILVVISIVIVMIALTFPIFGGAKRSARKTSAAQNLRQIWFAIDLYRSDNHGGTPGPFFVNRSGAPSSLLLTLRRDLRPLFKSPCGPHPFFGRGTPFNVHYRLGTGEEAQYREEEWDSYGDNLITVSDLACSAPDSRIESSESYKYALGVLLSGQLVVKQSTGDTRLAAFWSRQP